MDSFLVTLVIIAIAALSNWLQHRAQAGDQPHKDGGSKPPPRPRPIGGRPSPIPRMPRPAVETNLERELRRLLGGELVEPMSPSPAPPPRTAPVHVPTPMPAPPVMAGPPPKTTIVGGPSTAYSRAQQLHQSVALRLQQIDNQTEKHGQKPPRSIVTLHSKPVQPIFAVRGDREAARQAFVASFVFGTPKGLEGLGEP